MPDITEALDLAIEATRETFLRNPANFSDERALAEDTRRRLCSVLPPASVIAVTVEELSGAQGNIPDHEAYTARYRETPEIDRAQCEIGGAAFPFRANKRVDLAVLTDGVELEVKGGTQEFRPVDLTAAVEFKYVKNINYLRYRPDDENSKYHDIAGDIERLRQLPEPVDCRCMVYSNYDLLRRDSDADAEQGLRKLAEEEGVALEFVLPEPSV